MTSGTTTTNNSFKGHCYCGAVQFKVTCDKPIFPATYCHCDSCRRAHAAPLYRVVCIDEARDFEITQGAEHVQKFQKPDAPNGIARHFCNQCGTKIKNTFDADQPWWPAGVTKPMVFFPDTLEAETVANLPKMFQPTRHNCPGECVLDIPLINELTASGKACDRVS